MGFSRKRTGRNGKPRYTAYYLDIRGQERSAAPSPARGTPKGLAETPRPGQGRQAGRPRPRQADVPRPTSMEKWLPHHLLEPGVREKYT